MALINRITRLFRADLHSMLDRIEEPEALLRQAVREMEVDISNDERRLALLQHEQAQLSRRSQDLNESLSHLDDELDICFDSNEEGLARGLIKQKLELKFTQKLVDDKCEGSVAAVSQLKQRLQENQARLASVQQKLELVKDAESRSKGQFGEDREYGADYTAAQDAVSDDDVEVAFLGEKQRRVQS